MTNAPPLRIGLVVAGVILVMVGAELSNELLDFMDHGRPGLSGLMPLFRDLWGPTDIYYAAGGLIFLLFILGATLFRWGRSLGTSTAEVEQQKPEAPTAPANAQPVISRRFDDAAHEMAPARPWRVDPKASDIPHSAAGVNAVFARAHSSRHGAIDMRKILFPVIFGIAAIVIGIYEYYDLLAFETLGGTRKVHTIIKLLYESTGKWGVLIFFVVAGIAAFGYAGFKLARKRGDTQAA